MPTISFNISTGRMAHLQKAISGYNLELPPEDQIINADNFAKKILITNIPIYENRLAVYKFSQNQEVISAAANDDTAWNQILTIASGVLVPNNN